MTQTTISVAFETPNPRRPNTLRASEAKWGWACRHFDTEGPLVLGDFPQRAGDVVVARVTRIQNHGRVVDRAGRRCRIYLGDLVVGVLGSRYATDAFHGRAEVKQGRVHMLTNAGMMGQVIEKHGAIKNPTELEVIGSLLDPETSTPVNMVDLRFRSRLAPSPESKALLVVGTGMNAGKTTSATKLVRGLIAQGLRVAALKVTGSVCSSDRDALADAGAHYVADFSDYGFPSTYGVGDAELQALTRTMLLDAEDHAPDVIVVELADGILQSETARLVARLGPSTAGAVLAASCALSAMAAADRLERGGVKVHAITGLVTSAPLFVRELETISGRSVVSSTDDGTALGTALAAALERSALRSSAA